MNSPPENYESFTLNTEKTEVEKKSRNVWLLTCSIFAGVFLLIGLCAAFIAGIFAVTFGAMRSSTPYQEALTTVQTNNEAIEALGEPIEASWLMSGSVNVSGNSGEATFTIPVSGPKGEGTLYVEAQKYDGAWHYDLLALDIDGQPDRIHLTTR